MNFQKQLEAKKREVNSLFSEAKNHHELTVLKNQIIGKNSELNRIFSLSNKEQKKLFSQEWKSFKDFVENKFYFFAKEKLFDNSKQKNQIKFQEFKRIFDVKNDNLIKFDVNKFSDFATSGRPNPLFAIIEEIHAFFQKLNFTFYESKELDTTDYVFDNLNIPKNHPSRLEKNNFFIKENLLLRPHSTNMTAHFLKNTAATKIKEFACYSIGNVFRDDTDDANHLPQFMQLDVFFGGENNSFANLKWLIKKFIKFILGENVQFRFRLNQFPFTEPSFEVDIALSDQFSKIKWMEILGAGMIHPQVLKMCGRESNESVLAFGVGIERLAMIKYKIKDIRDLYGSSFCLN